MIVVYGEVQASRCFITTYDHSFFEGNGEGYSRESR